MKTISTMLFMVLIITSSCEKTEFKHDLIGDWNLYATSVGIYQQFMPYDSFYMSIQRGNDYQFNSNETIIEKGSFKIFRNENESFKTLGEFSIEFSSKHRLGTGADPITREPMIIENIANDTICLDDGTFEGFMFWFKRKK